MGGYTSDDFKDVTDRDALDGVLSSGYGPAGAPGTPEHAENVADALSYADGDIYYDYQSYAEDDGYASTASRHANVSSLQSAAAYAAGMLQALARNPDLLAQVQEAMDAGPSPAP